MRHKGVPRTTKRTPKLSILKDENNESGNNVVQDKNFDVTEYVIQGYDPNDGNDTASIIYVVPRSSPVLNLDVSKFPIFSHNMCYIAPLKDEEERNIMEENKQDTEDRETQIKKQPKPRSRSSENSPSSLNQCPKCPRQFASAYTLSKHMKAHKIQKKIFCPECPRCYSTQQEMDWHMICHQKETTIDDGNSPDVKQFKCNTCDKFYSKKHVLIQHIRTVHQNFKKFICEVCKKEYRRPDHLKKHFLTVHVPAHERPFKCILCGKGFASKYCLKVHQFVHEKERLEYRCDLCDRAFSDEFRFNSHKQFHEKDAGKAFLFKTSQQQAMVLSRNLNTNKKPTLFHCKSCNAVFKNKSLLVTHAKSHNDNRFKCKKCDRTYKNKTDLHVHERIHEPSKCVKCNDCGKLFPKESLLRRHAFVVHSKKLPNSSLLCPVCEKVFPTVVSLRYHEKVSHGNVSTPCNAGNVCKLCHVNFQLPSDLTKHLKVCVAQSRELNLKDLFDCVQSVDVLNMGLH